jgi:hypothetical protein
MKFTKIYLLLLVLMAGASCKKFVDETNPDTLTDPEFWKNENNVRAYNWEFYNLFMGYGNAGVTTADFYFNTFSDDQLPAAFTQYPLNTNPTNGEWSFNYIRKANIMLARVDGVPMSDEAKNHWKGIARFFRAMEYFRLVQFFGDVPWYSAQLDVSDSAQLYKLRDPRKMVMDSVLEDINFAVNNLRTADQANTIVKDVALALKSRICLFEGTYRKYHTELGLPDADKYLLEAKDAAQQLMTGTYILNPGYQNIYNNDNLNNNKEVILYKRYEPTYLMHSLIAYLYSSTVISGLTRSAVESYLCSDGKPIKLSAQYQGDDDVSKVMANRDKRLLITVDSTYYYYKGHVKNGLTSSTGYRVTKFLPDSNKLKTIQTGIGTNITDAPLFYYSEVLLNYIEAAAELDEMGKYALTQGDIDNTVNKLRARGGVAAMTLAGHQDPGYTDPEKDADVTSLIWEIRRERRVELMLNGFREQDLYRWKKGIYMDSEENPNSFLGAKVPVTAGVTNAEGYIMPYAATSQRKFVDPKNYLDAVPTNQILLYPMDMQDKMQNTGW